MRNTKEQILLAALRLFARDGYEAVSVSDIAGELGITKGALYRHYAGKRDIFESILERMVQRDAEQAREHDLPEGTRGEMEDRYRAASPDDVVEFSKTMFRYWTRDEVAAPFRRMLTLEQFRDAEMARLYQQLLVSGPMDYLSDLFAALGVPRARREAAEFYGAMFLLYGVYDGAEDKTAVTALADEVLESAGKRLKERMDRGYGQQGDRHSQGDGE